MAYWVKRIILKNGELLTERELAPHANRFDGPAPVVGDVITVSVGERSFLAEVVWGNWPARNGSRHPLEIVPIRVREI